MGIFAEIFCRKIFVDFVLLIFNLLPNSPLGRGFTDSVATDCLLIIYKVFLSRFQHCPMASKVIHTRKNLFCNVALICNLVQEFNGLVSKGLAIQLALLLLCPSGLLLCAFVFAFMRFPVFLGHRTFSFHFFFIIFFISTCAFQFRERC